MCWFEYFLVVLRFVLYLLFEIFVAFDDVVFCLLMLLVAFVCFGLWFDVWVFIDNVVVD